MKHKDEVIQPIIFLLMVITLFPIAISPSTEVLQKIGPGVIWIAAILSTLLSLDRVFRDDFADGSLEQLLLSGIPIVLIAVAKVFCHWVLTFGPLIAMMPVFSLFLSLSIHVSLALTLTLLIGTPVLSLLGVIGVSLTVGLRKGATVLSLLLIPVFIPLLIFATAATQNASIRLSYNWQLAMIGAILLFTCALAPSAIAFGLKVSQH